jgi:hypothetical protein
MRKNVMALTLVVALFTACSKQDKQSLTKEQRITAALNTTNPKRLAIAGKVLPSTPAGYELKEVVATSKETGFKSFGYMLVKKAGAPSTEQANPDWGTYTGYMLYSDGCYYHGTFIWSGDPSNYVFTADPNPNTDNYIGNEPKCMGDDDFDNFV